MNGQDLLEAMSHIDESLVAASEAPRSRRSPIRYISVAACLCAALLGVWTFGNGGSRKKMEGSSESLLSDTAVAAAAGASADPQDTPEAAYEETSCQTTREFQETADGSAVSSCSVRVEILEITQDGFLARVLETGDTFTQGQESRFVFADGYTPPFQPEPGMICLIDTEATLLPDGTVPVSYIREDEP